MDQKWIVIYGSADGPEGKALEQICQAVGDYYPGSLPCISGTQALTRELKDYNLIVSGTVSSNPFLTDMVADAPEKGWLIRVCKSPLSADKQVILLVGASPVDVLYAAVDFEHRYLVYARNEHTTSPVYYFNPLFSQPMKGYELRSAPAVRDRALWTWGYVIYDYRRYIDHMVRLKLNMLIIWNDFPPINANELVEYAHANGVRVIWGFAWGWDTNCLAVDLTNLEGLSNQIVETYERDYAHLKGDGIYFQSFTETDRQESGGVYIADAVTRLVNRTALKLWERYPGLTLQFGLHATSVKTKLQYLKQVHPDITIMWEDCGAFPYHYIPRNIDRFPETQAFTEEMMHLRGSGERYAAVLKGLTCLDWTRFVHQPGPYVLGCQSEEFIRKRTEAKREIWKYVQAYWIRNAEKARAVIHQLALGNAGNTVVAALVEDGMLEGKIWFPVALYAQMLWDDETPTEDLLTDVALWQDVTFA